MPDIDDDDTLSDAELDIIDLARHGEPLRIDLASAQEVERANRLLERGLMKVVGRHTEPNGAEWALIKRVEKGETVERAEPLVAAGPAGA